MPDINSFPLHISRDPSLETPITTPLYVNDGKLDPYQIAYLRPSSPSLPLEELRRRLASDSYLFLKGLLPRDHVLRARDAYFTSMIPTSLLAPNTLPVEGVFNPSKDPAHFPGIGAGSTGKNSRPGGANAELFVDLALAAHTDEWYSRDFCAVPGLKEFIAKLMGWGEESTLQFRRSLLRNNIPGTQAIGVHYDQIFLRYGEECNLTAWCPMGDIKLEGGGLIYLENSKDIAREIEANFTRTAKESGLTDEEAKSAFNNNMMATGLLSEKPAEFAKDVDRRWLVSAFEAGDVVLHDPFAIHASTVNHDPDGVIRLATDLRFADSSRPYDKRWCNYYRVGDGV